MQRYDDALTFAAVGIACEVVGAPIETALELFGGFFAEYAVKAGFYNQLRSLGRNLMELISNLNQLHHNIERDFPSAVFPVFIVKEEGDCNNVFLMQYNTSRMGLEPLLRGVLMKVADGLLNSDLTIEVLKSQKWSCTPRVAEQTEDTEVIWRLRVQARPDMVPKPHEPTSWMPKSFRRAVNRWRLRVQVCPEVVPKPPEPTSLKPRSLFSFFDIHNALACCCKSAKSDDKGSNIKNFPLLAAWQAQAKQIAIEKADRISQMSAHTNADKSQGIPAERRMEMARCLYRAVPADKVSSPWTDSEMLARTSDFWMPQNRLDEYYTWSFDFGDPDFRKSSKIWFLSHSWPPPDRWEEIMGKECKYSEIKATEACIVAKNFAAVEFGDPSRWPEVHYWIDKCSIPQSHSEMMGWCVNLIEEFIQLSDGLVVILSWSYFERLWCVYEWVCFLVYHQPSKIILCVDVFLRPSTLPLMINSIKNFSLKACKCVVESDREMLMKKVNSYYVSPEAFETFLKFSAIALIARNVAERQASLGAKAMQPWQNLAKACNFRALATKLQSLSANMRVWRSEAVNGALGMSLSLNLQTVIAKKVGAWFEEELAPLIHAQKVRAVRSK